MNLAGYGFLLMFVILSFMFGCAMIVSSLIVQPRMKRKMKSQSYECGLNPESDARIMFNAKYYMYAVLFLVFDIETIFLFPWAYAYNKIGLFALIEGIIFILILALGLLYAINNKLLEWK